MTLRPENITALIDNREQLPLDLSIREQTDSGIPTVVAEPMSPAAQAYALAARRMAARLAMQGKDYSRRFPNIVVEAG